MWKKHNASIMFFILALMVFTILYFTTFGITAFKGTAFKEPFDSATAMEDRGSPDTSHTVDMPLTTTTSCTNFCGPQSQCAKTRDQCTSDVDCPGCQPVLPPEDKSPTKDVPGQNDAGKLGYFAPQYSTLTTDIGTQAAFYYPASKISPGSKTAKVAQQQQSEIGLTAAGKEGQRLFNKKNAYLRRQGRWKYEPKYPPRDSATGLFLDEDGPLAANAYLSNKTNE